MKAQNDFQAKINNRKEGCRPLIYIDESGFAQDMPRRYGYTYQGQRCMGVHDWQAKGRVNVLGAQLGENLLTTCVVQGNVDSDVFHAWVTQELLRYVPEKSVIIMDNATFHKRADTQEAILSDGHELIFLPPYSPHLNPIEHKWAQAKAIRRREQCSVFELFSRYQL